MLFLLLVCLATLKCINASASWSPTPLCEEVTFNVTATALNRNLSTVDLTNITILTAQLEADAFPLVEVGGPQQIAGWFCLPTTFNENNGRLQFFMASITNNREAFTAQGGTALVSPPLKPYKPEIYSWVRYANEQGYATLTLDHLGNGLSSHPDPVLYVQAPYE